MRELNYFELEQVGYELEHQENKDKFMTEYTYAFTSIINPCKHKNGWYGRVHSFWSRFLELDGIRIYCCSDCGEMLQGKNLKSWQERRKNE